MRTRDMTQGNPLQLLINFALPVMAGSVFQQLYTIGDAAVVGRFVGVEALAAIGASDWMNWLILTLIIGFTQGFSIWMSQRFGGEDYSGLRKSYAMSALLTVVLAILVTGVGEIIAAPLLRLLDTPEEILPIALTYVRIYYGGMPIVACYNLLSGALRAVGDARSPLIAVVVASVTNILLDLLFVAVFQWGVAGAAAATLLAQGIAMVFCFVVIRRYPVLQTRKADRQLDLPLCGKLVKLGLPISLQNLVIAGGGIVVQAVVNSFGFLFIAGYTATNKMYGLLELAATAFGSALSVYTGQNLGAGRLDRIRSGQKTGVWVSLAVSVVTGGCMLLFARPILSLFISAEPEAYNTVMGYAYDFMRLMSLCLPVLYLLYVYRSVLQGMGNTVLPMVSGIVELVMRISSVLFLTKLVGEYGVYIAEVAAWAGAAVLLAIAYYVIMGRTIKRYLPET